MNLITDKIRSVTRKWCEDESMDSFIWINNDSTVGQFPFQIYNINHKI